MHSLSTPSCDPFRGSSTAQCTRSAHGLATFTKLKSSSWRVQVRRKRKYVNETFLRRKDAEEWALEVERRTDRSEPALVRGSRETKTLGDLIQLHRGDLLDGRSAEKEREQPAHSDRVRPAGSNGLRMRHSASVRSPRPQCRPLKTVARGAGHPLDLLTPS